MAASVSVRPVVTVPVLVKELSIPPKPIGVLEVGAPSVNALAGVLNPKFKPAPVVTVAAGVKELLKFNVGVAADEAAPPSPTSEFTINLYSL